MIEYAQLKPHHHKLTVPERLPAMANMATQLARKLPSGDTKWKLEFYHQLQHFIRFIAHQIAQNNNLPNTLRIGVSPDLDRFIELCFHFDMMSRDGEEFQFKTAYSVKSALPKKVVHGYRLVKDLMSLYRDSNAQVTRVKKTPWLRMIQAQKLDYEIRLAETLHELLQLQFSNKIPSPFPESYYTESGRNAFKNFTEPLFKNIVSQLDRENSVGQALDIGCGYGNYIAATNQTLETANITGLELQLDVFEDAQKKFKNTQSVSVLQEDILSYETDQKYDLILLNYVLFYFNSIEKEKLFTKLKKLLSPKGSVLVCQYYSGIELLKENLAKRQNDTGLSARIERFYGNKILYANALWNQTADTFQEAENWDTFNKQLEKTGLTVESLTNADRFYYSLFIRIKHSESL